MSSQDLQKKFLSRGPAKKGITVRSINFKLCNFRNKRNNEQSLMLVGIVQEANNKTLSKLIAFDKFEVFVDTEIFQQFEISGFAKPEINKLLLQKFTTIEHCHSAAEFPLIDQVYLRDLQSLPNTFVGITEKCLVASLILCKEPLDIICVNCGLQLSEKLFCSLCGCTSGTPNFGVTVQLSNGTDGIARAYCNASVISDSCSVGRCVQIFFHVCPNILYISAIVLISLTQTKSRQQTLNAIGLDLRSSYFGHSLLYIALKRKTRRSSFCQHGRRQNWQSRAYRNCCVIRHFALAELPRLNMPRDRLSLFSSNSTDS